MLIRTVASDTISPLRVIYNTVMNYFRFGLDFFCKGTEVDKKKIINSLLSITFRAESCIVISDFDLIIKVRVCLHIFHEFF